MATSARSVISPEQRESLVEAFDSGLNSTGKKKQTEISELAERLGLESHTVKNFITNLRRKRKKSARLEQTTTEEPPVIEEPAAIEELPAIEEPPSKRRLRALTHPSSYNLFHRDCIRSADAKALTTLAEKNSFCAARWRALSTEEKVKYERQAEELKKGTGTSGSANDNDKVSRRVASYLSSCAGYLDSYPDVHFMYTIVNKDHHYVGGTEKGVSYLKAHAHLPFSFMGWINEGPRETVSQPEQLANLRSNVEATFNELYASAIHQPRAKLPYSKITQKNISMSGLPEGIRLKHPSSYGCKQLKAILEQKMNLQIHVPAAEHGSSSVPAAEHGSSRSSLQPSSSSMHKPTGKVILLQNSLPVGRGSVVEGKHSHGHDIPAGMIRVLVEEIDDGICPPHSSVFDDEFLVPGQFCVWPIVELQ